jgi:dienelactone hydrolase
MKPERVYSIGFSLGSGVSSYLARHRKIDGQILFTPFDSIESIARRRYMIIPVSKLLKHPFRSDDYLRELDVPTAVITAGTDRVVPKNHSDRLISALARPVMVKTVGGTTHGGIYDQEETTQLLHEAFDTIERAAVEQSPAG